MVFVKLVTPYLDIRPTMHIKVQDSNDLNILCMQASQRRVDGNELPTNLLQTSLSAEYIIMFSHVKSEDDVNQSKLLVNC